MNVHKLNLTKILLTLPLLWILGCQQIPPSQMRRFSGTSAQFNQTSQPQVNYQSLFNSNTTQTPASNTSNSSAASQPVIEQNSCSQYTSKAENVINLCQNIVYYYEEDYSQYSPNCVRAFSQVTPQSSCATLVPQLNGMIGSCSGAFGLLGQYASQISGATNCLNAVRSLTSGPP
ncbi:hypothetical protein EBQ74_09870 [bacterium]|nr:hypothetical protein [bacterium]